MIALALLACRADPGRPSRADPRYPSPPAFDDGVVRVDVADDADDGEASPTRGWSEDGEDGEDLVGAERVAVFRFHLPAPLAGAPVYADLLLPVAPESSGTHLRIRAIADDDGKPLAEAPPSTRKLTDAVVDWQLPAPWEDPWGRKPRKLQQEERGCAPFERATPDLSPLLAELAPRHPSEVTLVLEEARGGGVFRFVDRADVQSTTCPGAVAARLEVYPTTRSALVGHELLSRPTDDGALLTLSSLVDLEVQVELHPVGGEARTTPLTRFPAGTIHVPLEGLGPDRSVRYRLRYRRPGEEAFTEGEEHGFHTARPRGSPFTFTVTSDGHFVNMEHRRAWSHEELLRRTMGQVALEHPDFHLDLGDTFNGESYRSFDAIDDEEMRRRHLAVRPWFELVGADAPVLLALGNHEGEQGWRVVAGDPVPELSARWRRELFPNPIPGPFATGNRDRDAQGPFEDYYAFEWGDALIVVLDPYRYTPRKPHDTDGTPGSDDSWDWTLGQAQYEWLRDTLAASDAPYELVFAHQVVGGNNTYGRGGRPFGDGGSYEWGGKNADGSPGFAEHRAGWAEPIHELLRDAHVTAFVHGHDHVFVWEPPLDGVGYVTVPQPGDAGYDTGHGVRSGYPDDDTLISNSGYLSFSVSPSKLEMSYVKVRLPGDGVPRERAFSHTFQPRAP